MSEVISKDGTQIAYEQTGAGPAVILVDGALSFRDHWGSRPLAAALSHEFAVITYDRRGRGESGDTRPYAVEREVEDIAVLIEAAGGPVYLYGISSGAALALHAAASLGTGKVRKMVLYEPPYSPPGDEAKQEFAQYTQKTADLLAANRFDDAVTLFLADVVPPEMLESMRNSPDWRILERLAPTLAYENAVMGDGAPPVEAAISTTVPTLVLDGEATFDFAREAADALAGLMPRAERRTLAGQTHQVSPEALAPVLAAYFRT